MKKKGLFKKGLKIVIFIAMLVGIVLTNALKLQNKDLSNHEKITDTGIRDYYDSPITPVIAALFYENIVSQSGFIQRGSQTKENAKMAVIPKAVSPFNRPVISKLYDEIPNRKKIKEIVIIYTDSKNIKLHEKIIKGKFPSAKVNKIKVDNEHSLKKEDVEDNLSSDEGMVIFLTNLDKGLNSEKSERLANEAIFYAQKNNYQMNVFDIVDDYVALSLETGDRFVYEHKEHEDDNNLAEQKKYLESFAAQYGDELLRIFVVNMQRAVQGETEIEVPHKVEKNYRLFDRGSICIKVQDADNVQIFEELKINQEESIIAIVAKAAMRIVKSAGDKQGKFFHIYLLTEMEQISDQNALILADYLDDDDGVYVSHQRQAALLMPQDIPNNTQDILKKLRASAKIRRNVKHKDLTFYRFKYVELQYEN